MRQVTVEFPAKPSKYQSDGAPSHSDLAPHLFWLGGAAFLALGAHNGLLYLSGPASSSSSSLL